MTWSRRAGSRQDGIGWEDWRADVGRELSAAERDDLRAKAEASRQQQAAELARRQTEAAQRGEEIWKKSCPCTSHPYLSKKGLAGSYGARLHNGLVVVPMRDESGKLWNLQFIPEEGRKNFLTGGRKAGCYYAIGGKPDGVILIGSGFATSASAHAASGYPIAAAFDDGNLSAVAKAMRAKYRDAKILIVADDDHLIVDNPGLTK